MLTSFNYEIHFSLNLFVIKKLDNFHKFFIKEQY